METITNAASSVGTTVSNLIYGQPAKDNETTTSNETAGKEPLSGQQGKGTVNEPFDQGNAENPVDTASKTNTFPDSSKDATTTSGDNQDDFLKLSPAVGKPANTESSTDTKTGPTSESSIPIVPLNPDVATMGGGKTNTTSSTESGITDKVWKPTALDAVKREGAPGAGPSAPDFTPATPETNLSSSTPNKAPEHHGTDGAKDFTPSGTTHGSSAPKKESVGGDIDAILESTPKTKHTVDDREAEDPHSKMAGMTVRQTDASKHGEGAEGKSLVSEKAGHKSEHSSSADASSPTGGDDKSGKMSQLKDKLKDKLHIGSKDK